MEMELINAAAANNGTTTTTLQVTEKNLAKAASLLKKDYVYMEDVSDILTTGLKLNRNVLLFGRGGHNKSVAAEKFLEIATGKTPYVIACHANMTIDDLFGPVSAKEYRENDRFIRNTEGSFINHEFVILEEMADMPTFVMEALKDALSSKQLRNGEQVVPVRTKFIVACTNKDPKTLILDESIEAFLQRFPLKLKVEWNSYKAKNYSRLFKVVLQDEYSTLSSLIESVSLHGTFVSPRIALEMANVYKNMGVEYLRFFDGVNAASMREFKEMLKNEQSLQEVSNMEHELNAITAQIAKLRKSYDMFKTQIETSSDIEMLRSSVEGQLDAERLELYKSLGKISSLNTKLNALVVPESAYERVMSLKSIATDTSSNLSMLDASLQQIAESLASGNAQHLSTSKSELDGLMNLLNGEDSESAE